MGNFETEVIARKLASLREALRLLQGSAEDLNLRYKTEPLHRAAVERWLQVAIEACIDIANYVIAANGWAMPDTGRASFRRLSEHALLTSELATRLGNAVGLRNLLVHEYADIDIETVQRVLEHDLADLHGFAALAASWCAVSAPQP